MRKILTDYFYYTRGERNGAIVLVTVACILIMLSNVLPTFLKTQEKYNHTFFEKDLIAIQAAIPYETVENTEGVSESISKTPALFPFNPNTATVDDFTRLGLTPKVANIIQHYREKGGHFYKKEDLKKIYGLKPEDYNRLEQFIEIKDDNLRFEKGQKEPYFKTQTVATRDIKTFTFDPNTASEMALLSLGIDEKVVKNMLKFREKGGKFYKKEDLKKIYGFSEIDYIRLEPYLQLTETQRLEEERRQTDLKKKESIGLKAPIDVNTATFDEWLEIRGIGRTFATRIIEHREKLGGFVSLEQLKEIHGLADSTFLSIVPQLKITTAVYRKISINKTTQNFSHPYLTQKQIMALVRYRMNHGNFKTIEDLKKVGVFSDEALHKLKFYLDLSE